MTQVNEITGAIIDAGLEVHRTLGPGLLESVYECCLAFEIESRGYKVERQITQHIVYKNKNFKDAFRLDMVVEDKVIVELKCVDQILAVHEAQILSYLKLSNKPIGLLLNFKSALFKDGIRRFVL